MIRISRKSCRENLITNRSFDMHKKHSTIQLMPDDLKTVCHVLSDHHIKKALMLDDGDIVGSSTPALSPSTHSGGWEIFKRKTSMFEKQISKFYFLFVNPRI